MKTFYCVRHGETDANVLNIMPGDLPYHLTDKGREQAKATGRALAGIKMDVVCSSDIVRAIETAEYIMEYQTCELVLEPRLRDLGFGIFAGMDREEVRQKYPDEWAALRKDPFGARRPGGESFADLMERQWSYITDVAKSLSDDKDWDIGIVSHGGNIAVLLGKIRGTREARAVPNCSISVIRYDKGHWSIVIPEDTSHLEVPSL